MKLHLNLPLRRALLSSLAAVSTLSGISQAGVADERYDLQYYLDFARNKGMFTPGAIDISVYYKDGSPLTNPVIPIMPNLDSYAQRGQILMGALSPLGGANLVAPQFVSSALHCYENDVFFLSENADTSVQYTSTGYTGEGAGDWSMQRLDKIVTEVAYTPMATDAFINGLKQNDQLYRLGNGGTYDTNGNSLHLNSNTLGGMINIETINHNWNGAGNHRIYATLRENDASGDTRPPLEIGVTQGDSGSPMFAWDENNQNFLYVGFLSAGYPISNYGNFLVMLSNPGKSQAFIDNCSTDVSFAGTETILWGNQNTSSGKGNLTQGETTYEYTGSGSSNNPYAHKGLDFSTTDTSQTQTLELQGSVNMGAGALTFVNGSWKLTEKETSYTFNSAGFIVNEGAELTLELTASAAEEWRKVGEGTMTIAGSGNNDAVLRVGGGETQYIIEKDAEGNIIGCSLGNKGETRLNRTGGYAASSVRLEAGVATIVLMQDNQFKTNSVAGDTFTFGNNGGLLNLNGHDLSWGVIRQEGSGKGARIGNFTPMGETAPQNATFTYTGTGTFDGCFMDEGAGDGKAQLAVKYNNAESGVWTLTGNHSNAGGFTVEAGTMKLQGINTPHVNMTDRGDWTYATLEGSDVTVKSGATFQLSHHALMTGNVNVEEGGSFVINQTVNAASESIGGNLRQDMVQLGITSFIGDVVLNGEASMVVATESPVATTMKGNIINNYNVQIPLPNNPNITMPGKKFATFTKQGSGVFVIDGQLQVPLGTVAEGGLVVTDSTNFVSTDSPTKWTINEKGFLAVQNLDNQTAVDCIHTDSKGVLALTSNQATALELDTHQNLIIGAWGNVTYGTLDTALGTVTDAEHGEVWRLGGGTGTLTVLFKLKGEADLLVGNEWSSGTVHLANSGNDFTGNIFIQGFGNTLTYEEGALGNASVSLPYGNAMSLTSASQLSIINSESDGILAVSTNDDLDLTGKSLSLGALGNHTYSGTLTVSDTYRFGGNGHLTLDTALDSADAMLIDGQGNSGSHVTFARENAFDGSIVAGAGLELAEKNSRGDIAIHVTHANALAATESVQLQKGAILYTDGRDVAVRNLSVQNGACIVNNGESDITLTLDVSNGVSTNIVDGAVGNNLNTAGLHIVKTGQGTLSLGNNTSWSGGLTIKEGTIKASATTDSSSSLVGLGARDMSIRVEAGGTLDLTFAHRSSGDIHQTSLPQYVSGTGTVRVSSGGAIMFTEKAAGFAGTVEVAGNSRLYIGNNFIESPSNSMVHGNLNVFKDATVRVTEGSQARITNMFRYGKGGAAAVTTSADFIIAGTGFKGSDNGKYGSGSQPLLAASLNGGALSIDLGSVITGNVTLADHATIASWSSGKLATTWNNFSYGTLTYGLKNALGGTIRGRILGEGKTLTIGGNEGMTFTADSANTFGNLVIANGNGNNDDKFALRLNGGKAVNQTSTALGMGDVTLNAGLILRLAGTGTANNTHVQYTYANDISAGNGATLQSYNITNRLTGTVSMSGTSLNLATANGGVLELAGGISGEGTLNIAGGSVISIGSAGATLSAGSPQFSGSIEAGAGADITLASSSVLSDSTSIIGSENLTLRFGGAEDYTLGGISGTSALTLHFDFTNTPTAENTDSWTTLSSTISAETTTIALDLNLFSDIEKGSYTLISTAGTDTTYQLADDMNGRLSLVTNAEGALALTVDADNRLFWRTGGSGSWNTTDANWYSDKAAGRTAFSSNANVMLDDSGVQEGNSSSARESITLDDSLTVGTIGVQEAAYELTGAGSLSGKSLVVGMGADMRLSNSGGNTFSEGVVVNRASLTVSGNTLTANVNVEESGHFSLSDGATLNGNLSIADAEATISQSTLAGDIAAKGSGSLVLESAAVSGARQIRFEDAGVLSAASGVTLSGTFTFAAKQPVLQAEGMSISGGSLSSAAALETDTLALNEASLKLTHAAGTTTQIGTITGNGSLVKEAAGNLSLGTATLSGLTLKGGGTTNISGTVTVSGQFSLGKETVNLVNGANVTVGQFTSGNTGSSQPTSVIIGEGAALTVTGNNDVDATNASFLLAHWSSSASSLVLNGGTLTAQNTSLLMSWDSGSTLEVAAGTASLKGIRFSTQRGHADRLILGAAETDSARINLGSAGISGIGANDTVQFGNGTIGATADFAINGNSAINMTGSSQGTVFDTAGHTVTVNTALSGAGKLIKQGEGTLLLHGNGSGYSGDILVNAGALAVDSTGKSVLESASSVSISSGTLDLSRLDFSDAVNAIRISEGQEFTLGADSTIAFGNLTAGTEYQIFDIGGFLNGWDAENLTAKDITIGGTLLEDMGKISFSLGMNGTFSYTLLEDRELVWHGGSTPASWKQNEIAGNWKEGETPADFVNLDSVAFNSDADLTLEGEIRVKNISLAEGVNLKTSGSLAILGEMTLGEGYSWSFSGNTSLRFREADLSKAAGLIVGEGATLIMEELTTAQNATSTAFNKVSGTGNVELHLRNDNGVGFDLSGVSGDITVATGRLQVNTSTFNSASDIYLATSASQLVFNGNAELKNDVVLNTDTSLHVNCPQNSPYTGTISGNLNGEGKTLRKEGGGKLVLSGMTTLGKLETMSGEVVIDGYSAQIGTLDSGLAGQASGILRLAENAQLQLTGDLWSRNSTGIRLEKGAQLALVAHNLYVVNDGSGTSSIKRPTGSDKYTLGTSNYEIANARVAYVGGDSATIANKLTNVVVENAVSYNTSPADLSYGDEVAPPVSEKTLTVTNADNTLRGVLATGGNVNLMNLQQACSLDILEIAAGRGVGAFVGSNTDETATVCVGSVARLGSGASLDGSLTLADGATLEMSGLDSGEAVVLIGTLTLGRGLSMGEQLLTDLRALNYGESLQLFTGLSNVSLPSVADDTGDGKVLAREVFTNVNDAQLYVTYQMIDNVGSLLVVHVPEPTTATLSLLALAALAARRRRKE